MYLVDDRGKRSMGSGWNRMLEAAFGSFLTQILDLGILKYTSARLRSYSGSDPERFRANARIPGDMDRGSAAGPRFFAGHPRETQMILGSILQALRR